MLVFSMAAAFSRASKTVPLFYKDISLAFLAAITTPSPQGFWAVCILRTFKLPIDHSDSPASAHEFYCVYISFLSSSVGNRRLPAWHIVPNQGVATVENETNIFRSRSPAKFGFHRTNLVLLNT